MYAGRHWRVLEFTIKLIKILSGFRKFFEKMVNRKDLCEVYMRVYVYVYALQVSWFLKGSIVFLVPVLLK
jgi:uncharacterized membrane protein